jgi:hypothetical protein
MALGISHICQLVAINLFDKYIIFEKNTAVALDFNLKMLAAIFLKASSFELSNLKSH